MKLVSLVAVLFLALPSHDMAYVGPIKSHEMRQVKVHLPAGKSTVEAWLDLGKLDCKFAPGYTGIEVEQADTYKCSVNLVTRDDIDYMVSITNLDSKDTTFRVLVHDTK